MLSYFDFSVFGDQNFHFMKCLGELSVETLNCLNGAGFYTNNLQKSSDSTSIDFLRKLGM